MNRALLLLALLGVCISAVHASPSRTLLGAADKKADKCSDDKYLPSYLAESCISYYCTAEGKAMISIKYDGICSWYSIIITSKSDASKCYGRLYANNYNMTVDCDEEYVMLISKTGYSGYPMSYYYPDSYGYCGESKASIKNSYWCRHYWKPKCNPDKQPCYKYNGTCVETSYYTDGCYCKPVYKNNYTVCREAYGDCDVKEYCTGYSADCPTDYFKNSTTVCRDALGPCDYPEYCTGYNATCPEPKLKCQTDGAPYDKFYCKAQYPSTKKLF